MSLRNKLITSIVAISSLLALLTVLIFGLITYLHIDKSVKEVYSTVSRTYTYIFKTLSQDSTDVVIELDNCKIKRANTYVLLREEGLFVGRVRDCVFYGTSFGEVIDFTVNINNLDWVLVYYREIIERINEERPEFFDRFIKDRTVLEDKIVEGSYDPKVLAQIDSLAGYRLANGFSTLLMDFPILADGSIPVGRVIFIKDMSPVLKNALVTPVLLFGYTLILVVTLSSTIFFLFDRIVKDISMLREVAYKFKELDFSDIDKLSGALRKEKRRDELFYLKRAVLTMAQELEALITQLKSEKDKLEELAYTDPLTGLSNRRFFLEEMKRVIETARRYREPLSIMMLDVDNFKRINDEYGHDVGDMILKQLAEVIRKNTRSSDIAARFGGEEFIVALPKTDERGALMVAERIRQEFKKSKVQVDGKEIGTTVSIGIASFEEGYDLDRLIKEADEALYEAKRTGKDKVVIRREEDRRQG